MFDVLVYLYETYGRPDAAPDHALLSRKLSAVGFESEEIEDALHWLDGLVLGAQDPRAPAPTTHSVRIYLPAERRLLGDEALGFITFLESSGVLTPTARELVLERASACGHPLPLHELKIIVLMVLWSLGQEPDALILDELFVAPQDRLIH